MKAVVVIDSDDAVVAAMASAIRFFILKALLLTHNRKRSRLTRDVVRLCCFDRVVPIPTLIVQRAKNKKEQRANKGCVMVQAVALFK